MPKKAPDNLQTGMILSKPVTNANGVVLLMEGTELTEAMIEKIRDINAESVYVKGAPESGILLEEMILVLDRRFKAVEGAPFMGIIKNAMREHIENIYG